MRRTKIVCTIGPATDDVEILKKLILGGMSTARINFSHGDMTTHIETVERLKQAREELNEPIGLLLDTKGPEIRTGNLIGADVLLKKGQKFTLTVEDVLGDETKTSISYKELPKDVTIGTRILIDDGSLELLVTEVDDKNIYCTVQLGGYLSSTKSVNIPGIFLNLPSLTQKDYDDLLFGIREGFDFVAASFIRNASDVLSIRQVLDENNGSHIQIISKIENEEGINNIEEILEVSDGIMVARGDLGVEIPAEDVPIVQKYLIKKANKAGKPVITATQMLESMISHPKPTRAEANDVANAILDGSDAIMLSGETAKGEYPILAVETMAKIAERAETAIDYKEKIVKYFSYGNSVTDAISYAACTTATELGTACIAAVTNSGYTARMVSKFRPSCPIVATTMKKHVWRQLNMVWGIKSTFSDKNPDDIQLNEAIEKAKEVNIAKNGDLVVLVAGIPMGATGSTNTIKVEMVGNVFCKGHAIGEGTISGKASIIKVLDEADKYFKQGDILVVNKTNNQWLPYIKKAKALIVGPISNPENSHAAIVAAALNIPAIVCNQMVIDAIPYNTHVRMDLETGIVYKEDGSDENK